MNLYNKFIKLKETVNKVENSALGKGVKTFLSEYCSRKRYAYMVDDDTKTIYLKRIYKQDLGYRVIFDEDV